MKKFTIFVALVALGAGMGLMAPRILAQPDTANEVQKWEQFCEVPMSLKERIEKRLPDWNARLKAHGDKGYQLVSVAGTTAERGAIFCYRRAAR